MERIVALGSRPVPEDVAAEAARRRREEEEQEEARQCALVMSRGGGGGGGGSGVVLPAGDEEEAKQLEIAMAMSMAEATNLIDFSEGEEEGKGGEEETQNEAAHADTEKRETDDGQETERIVLELVDGVIRSAIADDDVTEDAAADGETIVRQLVDGVIQSAIAGDRVGADGGNSESTAAPTSSAAESASAETSAAAGTNMSDNNGVTPLTSDEYWELVALRDFLRSTASQLTYSGLMALHEGMKPGEYAILFRNNHFSTVYKERVSADVVDGATEGSGGHLYSLVTDEGFEGESELVWERLAAVDGDTRFYNSFFERYTGPQQNDAAPITAMPDAGAGVAAPVGMATDTGNSGSESVGAGGSDADLALAMHLQAQEEAATQVSIGRNFMKSYLAEIFV